MSRQPRQIRMIVGGALLIALGVLIGATPAQAATKYWVGGAPLGSALSFDGTNDYVDVGNVLSNTGKLTISAWINLSSGIGSYAGVVVKGTAGRNYSLAVNAGGLSYLWTQGITSANNPVMSVTFSTGTWYHLVAVRDVGGAGGVIYVNGVQVFSDSGSAGGANSEVLGIGIGGNGFGYFKGLIDEVRIYNRALTAAEVAGLYNGSTAPDASGLVGLWNCDEGTGLTTADGSGSANTGTLTNGPTWSTGRSNTFFSSNANWSTTSGGANNTTAPVAGDDVVFDGGNVTNCTVNSIPNNLNSISVNAGYTGAITFSANAIANQDLTLTGNLTVNAGTIVLPGNASTTAATDGDPTDSTTNFGLGWTIRAANVTIASGAKIHADGLGFAGGAGPGKGEAGCGMTGGSHGGWAATNGGAIPATYGSGANPVALGSGGGSSGGCGGNGGPGAGGGAILLNLSGTLTVNGTLSANGANYTGSYSGGGSGGTLNVTANTLAGLGTISANGGNGYSPGGGGGRIRLNAPTVTFSGTLQADPGANGNGYFWLRAYPGTIVFHNNVNLAIGGAGNMPSLTLGSDGVTNYSFGTLTINSGGTLTVAGNTAMNSGSGGAATLSAAAMTVNSGGLLSANGWGFLTSGQGTGGGGNSGVGYGGGGSYGGVGGTGAFGGGVGGATYGSASAPIAVGSAGGNSSAGGSFYGGSGAGALLLNVSGTLTVSGTISANGTGSVNGSGNGGGGSGGSVNITAGTLTGGGSMTASGGSSWWGGGGGGGRIAVSYTTYAFTGTASVGGGAAPGSGAVGAGGTIFGFPPAGMALTITDPTTGSTTAISSATANLVVTGVPAIGTYRLANTTATFSGAGTSITSPAMVPSFTVTGWTLAAQTGVQKVWIEYVRDASAGGGTFTFSDSITAEVDNSPGTVSAFTATQGSGASVGTIMLSWTNPSDADLASLVVRYSTAASPAAVGDGTALTVAAPTAGATQTATLTNIQYNLTYYFAIWAKDTGGNYSSRVATTVATAPPGPYFAVTPTATVLLAGSGTTTFTVTAKDQDGNTLTNYSGSPTISAKNAAGTAVTITVTGGSWSNGVATYTSAAYDDAGKITLTWTDGTQTGSSSAITFYPSSFTVAAASAQIAGKPFTLTVTPKTATGATATGYAGAVTLSVTAVDPATTTVGLDPTAMTAANFVSGVGGLSTKYKEGGKITLTATDTTYAPAKTITGTSGQLTFGPGQIKVTPGAQPFGPLGSYAKVQPASATVEVYDITGAYKLLNTKGILVTLSSPAGLTFVNGASHTFDGTEPGSYTFANIIAPSAGVYFVTATSGTLTATSTIPLLFCEAVVRIGALATSAQTAYGGAQIIITRTPGGTAGGLNTADNGTMLLVTVTEATPDASVKVVSVNPARMAGGQAAITLQNTAFELVTVSGVATPALPVIGATGGVGAGATASAGVGQLTVEPATWTWSKDASSTTSFTILQFEQTPSAPTYTPYPTGTYTPPGTYPTPTGTYATSPTAPTSGYTTSYLTPPGGSYAPTGSYTPTGTYAPGTYGTFTAPTNTFTLVGASGQTYTMVAPTATQGYDLNVSMGTMLAQSGWASGPGSGAGSWSSGPGKWTMPPPGALGTPSGPGGFLGPPPAMRAQMQAAGQGKIDTLLASGAITASQAGFMRQNLATGMDTGRPPDGAGGLFSHEQMGMIGREMGQAMGQAAGTALRESGLPMAPPGLDAGGMPGPWMMGPGAGQPGPNAPFADSATAFMNFTPGQGWGLEHAPEQGAATWGAEEEQEHPVDAGAEGTSPAPTDHGAGVTAETTPATAPATVPSDAGPESLE